MLDSSKVPRLVLRETGKWKNLGHLLDEILRHDTHAQGENDWKSGRFKALPLQG